MVAISFPYTRVHPAGSRKCIVAFWTLPVFVIAVSPAVEVLVARDQRLGQQTSWCHM